MKKMFLCTVIAVLAAACSKPKNMPQPAQSAADSMYIDNWLEKTELQQP